jgi:adenosylcobinamide-GDP ribazoletransferase
MALGGALGPHAALIGTGLAAFSCYFMAWLSVRQIGGQTGDVLGALEQIVEIAVLLVAAGMWKTHR